MTAEESCTLAEKVPLFSELSKSDLTAICRVMFLREFEAGQTIVHEEDAQGQSFFVIVSGKVHVAATTAEGKQIILATLKKGDFFGEMTILDGEPRSASVAAAEHCSLFMLYRKSFLEILKRYPKIAIHILTEMSRRLRNANRQINTLSLMSVYGRIADLLLRLGRDHGKRVADLIIIPERPTHQQIAEMTGTTRETVTRVLSQLQKKRFISIDRRKIIILDEKKLYD